MSDYLTKPLTLSSLEACLERWLDREPNYSRDEIGGLLGADGSVVPLAPAALIDETVIEAIAALQAPGQNLLRRVVDLYIEHTPGLMAALVAAADAAPKDIASAAHALKSLSRNIGAIRVADACDHIEEAADKGGHPTAADLVRLETDLSMTASALRNRYGNATSDTSVATASGSN